jgi:hypothetical protein
MDEVYNKDVKIQLREVIMYSETFISVSDHDGPECRYYLVAGAGSYGISVLDIDTEEKLCIPEISSSRTEILDLIALMSAGSVSTLTFPDVVEDWLCT